MLAYPPYTLGEIMTYRMTAARRAALRKAQLASARKRRGRGRAKGKPRRRMSAKTRQRIVDGVAVGLAVAYVGANVRSTYKTVKVEKAKQRVAKQQRQRAAAYGYLRNMGYGGGTTARSYRVTSQRMRPMPGQLALPRGRS